MKIYVENFCLCVCLQHCKIYLCGTKNDLIQGDRSLRRIDYHDVQDFAEGIYSLAVRNLVLIWWLYRHSSVVKEVFQ